MAMNVMEQITCIHNLYGGEFNTYFSNSRGAKTFFNNLLFAKNENSFLKLKALKVVLWYCNNDWVTREYSYDLYLDINDENPFVLAQKIKGLFLLGAEKEGTQKAFKELMNHANAEVVSEAYFNSGLTTFFFSNTSNNIHETVQNLNLARERFSAAIEVIENRIDAAIFKDLSALLIDLISKKTNEVDKRIVKISKNLYNYQVAKFDNQLPILDLEVFQYLKNVKVISESLDEAENWYDYKAELTRLNKLILNMMSQSISELMFPNEISSTWKEKTKTNLINPILRNSLQAKTAAINSLRQSLGEDQLELKSFLDILIDDTFKKKDNTQLPLNINILKSLFPYLSLDILKKAIGSKKINQSSINVIASLVLEEQNQLFSPNASSKEKEILFDIRQQLEEKLSLSKEHLLNFLNVFTCILRYVAEGQKRNDSIFKVLYNNPDASEGEFQDSLLLFLKTSESWHKFEAEKQQFADGGRIDIVFADNQTTIPIEVKKTKKKFDSSSIYKKFLPQAQTYIAPYNQIGIFILFDVRKTKNTLASPGIKNLFWIDSVPSNIKTQNNLPDYVLNVIVPANKVSPSTKSTYG